MRHPRSALFSSLDKWPQCILEETLGKKAPFPGAFSHPTDQKSFAERSDISHAAMLKLSLLALTLSPAEVRPAALPRACAAAALPLCLSRALHSPRLRVSVTLQAERAECVPHPQPACSLLSRDVCAWLPGTRLRRCHAAQCAGASRCHQHEGRARLLDDYGQH